MPFTNGTVPLVVGHTNRSVDSSYVISSLNKHTKTAFCGEELLRLLKDLEFKIIIENQCL